MRRRLLVGTTMLATLALGTLAPSSALASPAGPTAAVAVPPVVVIAAFTYLPPTVVATAGSPISVINADGRVAGIPHSLTGAGFNTGQFTGGVKVIRAPKNRGVYPFRCTVHPFMRGVLVVR